MKKPWLLMYLSVFVFSSACYCDNSFVKAKTVFQTNTHYDRRLAICVDAVIVHQHANDPVKLVSSWKEKGFPVGRMYFADSDAGNIYWQGGWDGQKHLDDVERRQDGQVVKCANVRPYMLPTEGWIKFLEENTDRSLNAGADAILPEEPLAHVFTGYEGAFRNLWQQRYDTPWQGQHESDLARYMTAQLKNELYIKLEKRLLKRTKDFTKDGQKPGFVLPIHSIYSNIAAQLVAPLGTSLDIDGVDGYIGQIWTGPVNWALGHYESNEKNFFASAYILYDYFRQLTTRSDKKLWLLIDPVEDNPNHTWNEFEEWYKHCAAAMLLMEDVDSYEVMPWPDRIFLPGHQTGGKTPAPEDYLIKILSVTQVLQDIQKGGKWIDADQGNHKIGVAVSDTLMWQRHDGPWLQGMYGMLMPLVNEGVPVSSFVLERVTDKSYTNQFDCIVVCYDEFKPLKAQWNTALSVWVADGGKLAVLGTGRDQLGNYNSFWWHDKGFKNPVDHLLSLLDHKPGEKKWNYGKGQVSLCKETPRSNRDADFMRSLLPEISGDGYFAMKRGAYLVAHSTKKSFELKGKFLDIFDEKLSIIDQVRMAKGQSCIYKDVSGLCEGDVPLVLHATHRLMSQNYENAILSYEIKGPEDVPAVARIYTAEKDIRSITAEDAEGKPVNFNLSPGNDTLLISFGNSPEGIKVEIYFYP